MLAKRKGPWGRLTEKRQGVSLHYDGSASDKGAVKWMRDPDCRVSYNWLVLDNGEVEEIAPPDARAFHLGVSRSSDPVRLPYRDGNSAFYGVALAMDGDDVVTEEAKEALVTLVRGIFETHGWPLEETWRIVGHSSEAWPRRRKVDPEGDQEELGVRWPLLSVQEIRDRLKETANV